MTTIGAVGTSSIQAPTHAVRQAETEAPAPTIRDGFTPSGISAPAPQRASGAAAPAPAELPAAPQAEAAAPPKAKWGILVYSAADNNLKQYLIQNLDDAEKVGSTPETFVVSQLDEGGRKGASRLCILKDDQPGLHSQVVEKLGSIDMANPKTLADFIVWGQKNYEAENYFLIISDHGDGWRGAVEDDSHGHFMKLSQIEQGLQMAYDQTGVKMSVVGFDACLMANAEVTEQLGKLCDFIVASQETEGGAGWPYTRVLSENMLSTISQALTSKINLSPRDFVSHVVRAAETTQEDLPTMTGIETSKVPAMTSAVKRFADSILKNGDMPALKQAARETQAFCDTKDLFDFAKRVKECGSADDEMKAAAQGVMDAVKGMIVAEEHSGSYPDAHGLTIQLDGSNAEYRSLPFAQQTGWDKVNDKLSGKVAAQRSH